MHLRVYDVPVALLILGVRTRPCVPGMSTLYWHWLWTVLAWNDECGRFYPGYPFVQSFTVSVFNCSVSSPTLLPAIRSAVAPGTDSATLLQAVTSLPAHTPLCFVVQGVDTQGTGPFSPITS